MALSNQYVTELYAALAAFDGTQLLTGFDFNQDECAGSFYFESSNYHFNCSPAWGVFMCGEQLAADGVTEISIECGEGEADLPYVLCGEGEADLPYVLCGDIEKDVANYFNILKGWIAEYI